MFQTPTRLLAVGLLASTLLGSGCAGSYSAIRPDRLATYQAAPTNSPLQFSYQFDALRLHGGNKKYVKKELKNGYHVVAVRVTNTTAATVNFSRDAVLYYGERAVVPVSPIMAAQDMKQGVPIYLLYLLLNFRVGATTNYNGTTTGGTFIPTGPFIAGGNMLGASQANANFRRELEQFDLTNRDIRPGETVAGLISLRETAVAPMRLELRTVATVAPTTQPAAPTSAPTQAPTPAQALPGTPGPAKPAGTSN